MTKQPCFSIIGQATSLENYSRGRRGAPAKGVGRETGARVQIPHSPLRLKRGKNLSEDTEQKVLSVLLYHAPDWYLGALMCLTTEVVPRFNSSPAAKAVRGFFYTTMG